MARATRYKGIKKLGDRTYHVRVSITDPRTGTRREKKDTVHGTMDDALAVREQLRGVLTGRDAEEPSAKRQQLREYAESWMKRKRHEVAPTTADRYAVALEQHVLPHLGDLYFDAITRHD